MPGSSGHGRSRLLDSRYAGIGGLAMFGHVSMANGYWRQAIHSSTVGRAGGQVTIRGSIFGWTNLTCR